MTTPEECKAKGFPHGAQVDFTRDGETIFTSFNLEHIPREGESLHLMKCLETKYTVASILHFYGMGQSVHTIKVVLIIDMSRHEKELAKQQHAALVDERSRQFRQCNGVRYLMSGMGEA